MAGKPATATPDEIVTDLVLSEAWRIDDRKYVAQPAQLGDLNESLDRAFDLGARRALQALKNAGFIKER